MRCTDALWEEHESMTIFLTILEKNIEKLESCRSASLQDLHWLFEFNRDFVIRYHHRKEEKLFFPVMQEMGVPEETIGLLTAEHEMMRKTAKRARAFVEEYREGRSRAISELIDAGRMYLSLMKAHIENEESIFYPLAAECFSDEMDERLLVKFRLFEDGCLGSGRLEDLRETLNYLKTFYGIEIQIHDQRIC